MTPFLVERLVQKAGDQVRITAQLADAITADLWSESYAARRLRDVFSLQDEIVRRIVTTVNLQVNLWDPARGTRAKAHQQLKYQRQLPDPEVASVGLTPLRAAEEGVALDTHRLELSKVERAFIDGEEEGFATIYSRKGTGQIVGATLVAALAGEMISEMTLAVTNKLTWKL